MKYNVGFKFLAILLAACMLMAMAGSVAGIILLSQAGLYTGSLENWKEAAMESQAMTLASRVLDRYTAVNLGKCTTDQLEYVNRNYTDEELSGWFGVQAGSWNYRIADLTGQIMESTYSGRVSEDVFTYSFTMTSDYPVHVSASESEQVELTTDWEYRDYYYTETEEHFLYYYQSPTYEVTVRMLPNAAISYQGLKVEEAQWLYSIRYWVIAILGASLLVFALCAVYLCYAAGRSPRSPEVHPGGLNRLPLDLYALAAGGGCVLLCALAYQIIQEMYYYQDSFNAGFFSLALILVLLATVIVIGFFYAFAAQVKRKGGYWWRHSVIGWCLRKIGQGIRFCFRALGKLLRMLPLIWQWLLTAALMVIVPLFCLFMAAYTYNFFRFVFAVWTILACVADVVIVCYGAYAFGVLLKGAKRMSQGDLDVKINTKYLFGAFRDFADQLNTLADAAMVAAKNQMKSDRMKTELITNVSHDIKTPLTSLINYVDLLEKPHTEEEGRQYLEVLGRQSQRLKKLIDDLMDMSKATTGNMSVDITQVDAAEAVNQALGEFADKLDAARLTPVFRQPEECAVMLADGRLTWRVLSNLLSNIVKYALPGTRVYIDLVKLDGRVLISLKNISREELNVSADELTERFVRGDTSRNTEGSGLGLNIAKSLMELQRGQLQLLVDGDLFKATLVFPGV